MSDTIVCAGQHVAPNQVWVHLARECQRRVIHLIAQLAFNFIAAQVTDFSQEEHDAASASQQSQNPS